MKVLLITFLITFASNYTFADWQGARVIEGSFPGGSLAYAIATDHSGYPWVIWHRGDFKFTKWNGTDWEEPRSVPPIIGAAGGYIDFIIDEDNKLFLIYPTQDRQNHCDIFSARYYPVSDSWELPKQVNDPDTTILDEYYPRISIGGEEIWSAWLDEKDDSVISNIKASRWNPELQEWEPEMTVNSDSGGINRMDWFPDVAVVTTGIPHIVWVQHRYQLPSRIRYSKFENDRWIEPIQITNPDSLIPTGAYGGVRPKLVLDSHNILHCVFTGYRPDSSPVIVRVYYTKNEGIVWNTPTAFDTFSTSGSPVWECDMALDRSDNIWVVWDRGGGSHRQIFVSHFNGNQWSLEERIDDGRTRYGGFPRIALDGSGNPFVIWTADTSGAYAIWYNRYVSSTIEEKKEELPNFRFVSSFNRIEIKYTLLHKDRVKVKVYDINGRMVGNLLDELQEAGDHTLTWNRRIPQGVYFIHLETSNDKYRAKTVIVH